MLYFYLNTITRSRLECVARQIRKDTFKKKTPLRSDQKIAGNVFPGNVITRNSGEILSEKHRTLNTLLQRLIQNKYNFKECRFKYLHKL